MRARAIDSLCFFLRSHTDTDTDTDSHTLTLPPATLFIAVMFDFEKLDVYKKAKAFNSGIRTFIRDTKLDNTTRDQLRRALKTV